MRALVSVVIALFFGLVVLIGYFIQIPFLVVIRDYLLQSALIVAAVALLVGAGNLLNVHIKKISTDLKSGFYSSILIASLFITIIIVGFFGPQDNTSMWIFNNIQLSTETSLLALLSIALLIALIRLLQRRLNAFTVIFVITALLSLAGMSPLLGIEVPLVYGAGGLHVFISNVLATAGARGILIGVALGTLMTGLRILMGADRPSGG